MATIFLTAFFASHATITGILHPLFDCDVHGLLYQCVVPNSKFFFVVHFISMLALFAYFLCVIAQYINAMKEEEEQPEMEEQMPMMAAEQMMDMMMD